jgi:hypothetical protein
MPSIVSKVALNVAAFFCAAANYVLRSLLISRQSGTIIFPTSDDTLYYGVPTDILRSNVPFSPVMVYLFDDRTGDHINVATLGGKS